MNEVNGFVLLSSILQPGLVGYALRLNRVFGSRHVGWWVFWAFVCLTLLHLVHLLQPAGGSAGFLDVVISLLLLVGMAHAESFCAGRARLESKQKELHAGLERVTAQVVELGSANENLLRQLLVREQREQLLKASEHQLSLLFFENPQPMWVFDLRSLRVLSINEAALRYYGYCASELTTRTAQDLLVPEDIPAFLEDCAQTASRAGTPRLWRHRGKDGGVLEVEALVLDLVYDGCPARLIVAHDASRPRPSESPQTPGSLSTQLWNLDALIENAMKTLDG